MRAFVFVLFSLLLFSFVCAEVSSSTQTTFYIEKDSAVVADSGAVGDSASGSSGDLLWFLVAVVLIVLGVYFFVKHKGRVHCSSKSSKGKSSKKLSRRRKKK